ncbi:M14 family metallopeptidase [Stakelama saccharophila]|uniref:M14-type cytosolic carboxypeptidase n=1 Tax=Stakelama saccharophila TaxID=3075605 RepID=A0ABZ0BD19_9SPHN|nr:M14-type cytosolic carboxypeptidase [Stakelama sp. W311]WNO54596.1 M14-type cytosolic carboxypeptidase [Stakelama sp. W311]
MTIQINSAFDGGNIRLLSVDGDRVDLEIVKDRDSDFFQWFHFRVAGAKGKTLTFRILNAGKSAYPFGWPGYRARVSTDRQTWRIAETDYADGVLRFTHSFEDDLAWFAYFAPYTVERHNQLVADMARRDGVRHVELGKTLDGRALDYLTLGDGAKQVWLYARQHPGESMAEWWMEGALEKLTDPDDETAKALRSRATFHIVPNMNPDGSYRGHLRTNAVGTNLNREWDTPSMERSPEVFLVKAKMDETGVDVAMDIHGDEAIPANFLAGFEGIPSWTDELGDKFTAYARRLEAASPDFQTEKGYEKSAPGKANLSMSTNQVAERFHALSMTLEMPFKDHDPNADAEFAWSPERCKTLAHAGLAVLADMIDEI